MSRKEKRLYVFLALLFVMYVVVEHYKPEPLVWVPTFDQNDKQPYGGHVFYDRLGDFFTEKELSFQTMYEHGDSLEGQIIILSSEFRLSKEDLEIMMSRLRKGNDLLIASSFFEKAFLDSIGLKLDTDFKSASIQAMDSVKITFEGEEVYYPKGQIVAVFDLKDSSGWNVVAHAHKPVVVYKNFGEGRLVLSTHPLAFTNYGLLKSDGLFLPELAMNHLRPGVVSYNRYYHSGRLESQTPLRFLISQPPLRWALNLTLVAIVILLVVGSRRKQAKIGLLDPKTNTTIQFIKTLGGLYYREGKHKNAANKLVSHFIKTLKEKYYITNLFDESTYHSLAVRTGMKKADVIKTFEIIQHIRKGHVVSEPMLLELNKRIEEFNIK